MIRAASPGAVSFVQFEKDRNRSKKFTRLENIVNYCAFYVNENEFLHDSLFNINEKQCLVMRGKIPTQ
jgi:hypothetical protein